MTDILTQIKKEIEAYKEDSIETSPGVYFSQYKTLKKANAYKSSKFEKGDIDPLTKKKKVFFQISRFRARVTAKMLDFDVKDLRVISNRVFDLFAQLKAYLLEKRIKNWAKENGFTTVLNDIVQSCADYGSAVVKKPKGKPAEVKDLKYIYLDTSVRNIHDSAFIIEEKEMRRDEIEAKKDSWDNVDEVLRIFADDEKIKIYERYGIVEEDGEFKKKMTITTDRTGRGKKGLILFDEEIDEYPYQDFHINKIDGRWLGMGTYEELFDIQIRTNTIANQKARALELSSRQIFWSPDDLVAQNIMKDLDIGDILKAQNISPLQVENRGLSEFVSDEQRYDELADRLTFTFDAIRGESLPSTTPATNALLQNENAASVFQQMRENLATQIVKFIKELVLPDVVKVSRSEHVLKFMGDMKDLEKFDRLFTNQISQQTAYKYLSKTGFYPEKGSIMKLEETISKKLKDSGLFRSVKIPAGFFSNISDVDIMMDNESRDIPLQTQNLQTLIGMIMPNPQALDNPLIKSIIYAYSELLGISPVELELAQNEQNQNANLQTTQGRLPQVNPEQGLATGQRTSQPILR